MNRDDELYDIMTADEYAFATFVIEKANALVKAKNESLVRDNAVLRESQKKATGQIMDLKKQIVDLPKIEKAAHKQAVTDLFGGFNVRQDVWVVGVDYLKTSCTACTGGQITIQLEGTETAIKCPKCEGETTISTRVYVARLKKIQSISYEVSARNHENITFISVYMKDDGKYKIDELYHTEDECQVEVDRRNSV